MTFFAAHRGLSAEHHENTVAAFRAAADAGAQGIELDVRLTHDGVVVVLHDAGIERTTDGNGRVADFDYAELVEYDTGEGPVPRLDDVFSALAEWQGQWNIEIKAHPATVGALELLAKHGLVGRCQVSSLDPRALMAAQKHMPEVPRGLITLGPPDDDDLEMAEELGCTWINVDHEYITHDLVDHWHEKGLRVGAWTVNDVDRAEALMEIGVDCIISDARDVLRLGAA